MELKAKHSITQLTPITNGTSNNETPKVGPYAYSPKITPVLTPATSRKNPPKNTTIESVIKERLWAKEKYKISSETMRLIGVRLTVKSRV